MVSVPWVMTKCVFKSFSIWDRTLARSAWSFRCRLFHQGNDVVVKVHQGVGQDGGRNRIADFELAERIEVDFVDRTAC